MHVSILLAKEVYLEMLALKNPSITKVFEKEDSSTSLSKLKKIIYKYEGVVKKVVIL